MLSNSKRALACKRAGERQGRNFDSLVEVIAVDCVVREMTSARTAFPEPYSSTITFRKLSSFHKHHCLKLLLKNHCTVCYRLASVVDTWLWCASCPSFSGMLDLRVAVGPFS